MAKNTVKARALIDIHGTPVKSGQFFIAAEDVVKGLVKGGQADSDATEESVYGKDIPAAIDLTATEIAPAAADAAAAALASVDEEVQA